jgi:hypothetical protein
MTDDNQRHNVCKDAEPKESWDGQRDVYVDQINDLSDQTGKQSNPGPAN